jgi:hypothetical protein
MTPCVGWPLVWCGVAGCVSAGGTALLCPSSGARDYTEGYSMWHMTPCVDWPLVWCQPATPHQTSGQHAQGVMCHML